MSDTARTSASHPFAEASEASTSSSKREGGSSMAAQSGSSSGSSNTKRSAGGSSLWDQWMTGTGWFAPLVPPEAPEKLLEKQKQAEEQRRKEKERSVHSWRESQDTTSPMKGNATRPSLMKRLSSAVELKWWAADAPAPGEDATNTEEEDLQRPRGRGASIGSMRGQSTLQTMQENEHDSEPSTARNSQEIQMR